MFEGTSHIFRVLYFISAMMPAYILFVLQINNNVDELQKWTWSAQILGISVLCGCLILTMLKQQKKVGVKKNHFKIASIENKNGEVVSFLLGVIIPSVIIPSDINVFGQLFIFVSLQLIIFTIMCKSSSVFPNIVILLFGVDVFEINQGEYLFTLQKKILRSDISNDEQNENNICVSRYGDSRESNSYIY